MPDSAVSIPEEFLKVIKDFVKDMKTTFPEYETVIKSWWKTQEDFISIEDEEERKNAIENAEQNSTTVLFNYCKKKFPPRFFDILYQNADIFNEDSVIDTEFLPKVHFKNLWHSDISDKTKETIWKYLQLMSFSIVGTLDNKDAFGDTSKMFEAINEDEFKTKLQDTLSQMQGLFDLNGNGGDSDDTTSGINAGDIPNAEELHDHITGMLDGKLGQLAREIAEETASNLNMDMEGATNMNDVFQNLVKNPAKLMDLVKNVGSKLDTKIKSGDIKESEIMSEASEMMAKMKNMPGMGNIQSMLSKMGLGDLSGLAGGGGGGKVNTAATEAKINQQMKLAKTKERIRAKAESNAQAKLAQQLLAQQNTVQQPVYTDEELIKMFQTADKPERTLRGSGPTNNKKKKKK